MYTISFNPPRNLVRDVLLTPIILVATEATNFLISINRMISIGLLRWLSGKESTCQAGDAGSIPESGRSTAIGDDNPLPYSWEYQEIPWTEESGGLQSLRSQRVREDLTIKE